jgi:hypothetical protein
MVAETVVQDTPYDRVHILKRIINTWGPLDGRLTNETIAERARVEYGNGVLQVGTVSQLRRLADLSDEALSYMRTACVGVPGIAAGKNHVYFGLMSKATEAETLDRVSPFIYHTFTEPILQYGLFFNQTNVLNSAVF